MNRRRQLAFECALIAGGVAIAIVTVLTKFGGTLNKFFVTLSARLFDAQGVIISVDVVIFIFLIYAAYDYKSHS